MYQWRKFEFFEEKYGGKRIIEEGVGEISCCGSGRGKVVVGCEDGTVSLLDRGFKFSSAFQAHTSNVLFIQQLKGYDSSRLESKAWTNASNRRPPICSFGSTSQCAQPNPTTFEMTMDWRTTEKKLELCYLGCIVLGKVKEFASLTNLKVVLGKEGYANNELKYMGDERVIWVEVEGVPCKWWSRNTFSRIASRWGTLLNEEELEEEDYHSNRICIHTKLKTVVFDTFKMVYRGMTCWVHAIEVPGWVPDFEEDGEEGYDVNDGSHEDDMHGGASENLKDVKGESDREEVPETNFEEGWKNIDDKHEDSLKYPLGFTPNEEGDVPVEKVDNWSDENRVNDGPKDRVCVGQHVHERVEVSNDIHESTCYGHFKKSEVPRKGGSILELIDDLVNV
nr:nucleotide-binding alpha-beta plait domain-containing protein [Tanacetum cinerariifolium]